MGRIRSIKPEIVSDEVLGQLPDAEWRLYFSMLPNADDYGNIGANPKQLDAMVFWARVDRADVVAMLRRLEGDDLITLYRVRGQTYLHINGWTGQSATSQKVDHPGKPIFPGPDEADRQPDLFDAVLTRESLARVARMAPRSSRDLASASRGIVDKPPKLLEPLQGVDSSRDSREVLAPDRDRDQDQDRDRAPPISAESGRGANENGASSDPPITTDPDSPHNLLHFMSCVAQRRRPRLGMWSPGRFADRDAVDFYSRIPKQRLREVVPIIRKRVWLFFDHADPDGWPLKNFLDRFNALGSPGLSQIPQAFNPEAEVR